MQAVIKVGGKQYLVKEKEKIKVEKLKEKEGEKISLNEVLLLIDDQKVEIGQPFLPQVSIQAKVLKHGRGKKIVVFKYKRRKGYRKKQGHRQPFTEIIIEKISKGKKTT